MNPQPVHSAALIIMLAVSIPAWTQSDYIIDNYTVKDGLGGEFSSTMAQDKYGYIWIHNGLTLSKFDGHAFRVYRPDPKDSTSLGSIVDGGVLSDPLGNIWVTNYPRLFNGQLIFYQYNDSTDAFTHYRPNIKNVDPNRYCFDTSTSKVWIGTGAGGGLFSFDFGKKETHNFLQQNTDKVSQKDLNSIRDLKDFGTFLLLATRKGLWKFDKQSGAFTRPPCNSADSSLLFSSVIDRITIPSGSNAKEIWIEANKTLVRLDPDFNTTYRVSLPAQLNTARYAYDSDGQFWFMASGFNNPGQGIDKFNPLDSSITRITSLSEDYTSLQTAQLGSIFIDRDENIWISSWNRGIFRLTKPALSFYNSTFEGQIGSCSQLRIQDQDYLVVAHENTQVKGSPVKLLIAPFEKSASLKFQNIKTTVPIEGRINNASVGSNTFWMGTWASGVIGLPLNPGSGMIEPGPAAILKSDPKNSNTLSSNVTSGVWEDEQKNLWVGTYDQGLNKIIIRKPYGTEGSVMRFRHNEKDSTSLSNDVIWWEFAQEEANAVWVVTASGIDLFENGIFKHPFKHSNSCGIFNSSTDASYIVAIPGLYEGRKVNGEYRFSEVPSFQNRDLLAVQSDRLGRLWITQKQIGIILFDRNTKHVIEFDHNDGIKHSRDLIFQSSEGLMAISDQEGITVFDPTTFVLSATKVQPQFTNLLVNNHTTNAASLTGDSFFTLPIGVSHLKDLTLDYLRNNFTLEFSAMEMTAPEKNLYRHMLEGYDEDWIETDYKNRTATYTNLPAGPYTFKVKASNHHGVWSDNERTLKVIILPPPWRTWWAYTGYGLVVVGLLVWARRNIVKQERLAASLQVAKVEQEKEHFELEKAKEVDKVKSSFFTNISHEFRTPLTLIKGPIQNILDKYKDDPKLQEQLKLVQRNSDLLLKLINQLLDLAKLESGSLKVEKTEGDVFSFVRAIASSFESFARQKNVSILVDVPSESCAALFDKDKVETILINLINNAIKFTPAGGSVFVTASINESQLQLSVKDTGIGIPSDQQSKIFERFHQVSEAHKEVGTGIGLALVKELVALMGGEISVTSEVGRGSEFKVMLPIEVTSRQTTWSGLTTIVEVAPSLEGMSNAEQRMLNDEVDSTKPQVLVVEDNTDLRKFIIDSLGNEFQFLEAENGTQGLDIATTEVPDLIISDVMMPEMDGITMAGKIKNDIRSSHIPLILLTAKFSEDSKLSGLSSGADDYLTKPFNKNELLLKVRNGVSRQLKLREKLRAELMSTAPRVEVLSEDERFLNSVKERILERLSDEQLSVESLADDMGMSRVQLYRKISGLTDISVNELIRKLRLQRASQLLQQNWGPVSRVAYEVGFSNLSYFSKVFKEEFGVLPSEYADHEK